MALIHLTIKGKTDVRVDSPCVDLSGVEMSFLICPVTTTLNDKIDNFYDFLHWQHWQNLKLVPGVMSVGYKYCKDLQLKTSLLQDVKSFTKLKTMLSVRPYL